MPLPRSAVLSLWFNAVLDGAVGPDDYAGAVRGDDPQHLVVGLPGHEDGVRLEDLPGLARRSTIRSAALALPVAGDPLGLAGPSAFNAEALDRGEGVVLIGERSVGLVPALDARTVVWSTLPAARPVMLDPFEEDRMLRQVLVTTTAELVRLDVASWQPEIPDLLLNLDHRPPLDLPPGTPQRAAESLERAALCREILDLARADDGGAVSGFEVAARMRCLNDLDVAARRTLVAFCSASLVTP